MPATPSCQRHCSGAEIEQGDEVVRQVGEQDSDDDVDLEQSDHSSAPLGRREFGDVDRAEHGRAADAESADEAEDHQQGQFQAKAQPRAEMV